MSEETVVLPDPVESQTVETNATDTSANVVDVEQPVVESTEKESESVVDSKEQHANRVQKRIDKLTREKYELKGRLDAMESMLAKTQQQPEQESVLSRDQFNSDADFINASVQHEVKKQVQVIQQQFQQNQQRPVANIEDVKKVYADYDDVIVDADSVRVPQPAVDAIMASDYSEHLKYFLTKHPEKADGLFRMSPIAAIREIGKYEAIIENDIAKGKEIKPKVPVSKAPAPIKPVTPKGDDGIIDESKLSDKQWFERDRLKRLGKLK